MLMTFSVKMWLIIILKVAEKQGFSITLRKITRGCKKLPPLPPAPHTHTHPTLFSVKDTKIIVTELESGFKEHLMLLQLVVLLLDFYATLIASRYNVNTCFLDLRTAYIYSDLIYLSIM